MDFYRDAAPKLDIASLIAEVILSHDHQQKIILLMLVHYLKSYLSSQFKFYIHQKHKLISQ